MPAGPVLDIRQMHADPQALARGMIVETVHPSCGKGEGHRPADKILGNAGRRDPASAAVRSAHTRSFARTWLHDEEIDKLAASGAIETKNPNEALKS